MSGWQDDAACRGHPDADRVFFPPKGVSGREARRVCSCCPVRVDCLEDALATVEEFGVRGGLSPQARRKLLRRGAAA